MREVTRPPRAPATGGAYGATPNDYLAPQTIGLGYHAAPPPATHLPAQPGPFPHYHGGPMGYGFPAPGGPTIPMQSPASPWR